MMTQLFERYGKVFEEGETLFHEGDPGSIMYVVVSGTIRISKRVGGEDKTLALIQDGEFFGEMAILNNKPRTATATVLRGPAKCVVVDAKTFEVMVTKSTEIAVRLIRRLAQRLDTADALIEVLMHRDPKARLLLGFMRRAEAFGRPQQEGGIVVEASAEDLANEVGVDLDIALATFARLKRLKLLTDVGDGRVLVPSLDRLEEFLEYLEGGTVAQS